MPRALLRIVFVTIIAILSCPVSAQNRERVQCFSAYDDDFFYLAAVVQKPNLAGRNAPPFSNPVADDAIAVFLQKGEAGTKRSADSVQMAVSAAGGAQIYRGEDAKPLAGFQDFKTDSTGARIPFKYRSRVSGELNKPGGTETGYTVEMAIPWVELGGPPKPGNRMRFNVVAFSAAAGSSPIVSLAPGVKTAADLHNPTLWPEIAFVDSAIRQIEGAPELRISPRVFAIKPLIDGVVASGEWNTLTSFMFGEGAGIGPSAAFTANSATGRAKPKVNLSKAPPRLTIPARPAAKPAPRNPQAVPRLVFAVYDYSVQADPRKKLPLNSPRKEDGTSLLATHPLDGEGPWMTYDRVNWHVQNADQMRQAGIDAILPVYRVGGEASAVYARRGLLTLASALRALQAADRPHPAVAMMLATDSFAFNSKPDLKDPVTQARVYGAIKEFFLHIPSPFRLSLPLDAANGGGFANVVVLSSASPFSSVDGSFLQYCRARFMEDFGSDLILLGSSDFKAANLDGYVNDTRGRGFQMDESGWIKPASIGTGVEGSVSKDVKLRNEGETYRGDWKQAIDRKADWVFIEGWNDFRAGSEIAPTLEHGMRYSDLTRLFTRVFTTAGARKPAVLSHNVPRYLPVDSTAGISVRLQGSDADPWASDTHVVVYQWKKSAATAGQRHTLPLPSTAVPGRPFAVSFHTPTPAEPGEYTFAVDVAALDKNGAIGPPAAGVAPLLSKAVRIVGAGEAPDAALSPVLVSSDVSNSVEAGGTYDVAVTIKNVGASTWKKGGARITARLDRISSGAASADGRETVQPVEIADATAELPADLKPGEEVTVRIALTLANAEGEPIPISSPAADSSYLLFFEVTANGRGALTHPQAIGIAERDLGAVFSSILMPVELPAGRSLPVRMSLRNSGPQAWLKESTVVGYHWYFLDGVEAQWEGQTTPIPRDLEPGGEITDLLSFVTAPPTDGRYWLVWDVKIGDTWVSTQPGIRPNETRVHAVEVIKGGMTYADLTSAFNVDGITTDEDRADGSIDAGRSLPAEQVPPFAAGEVTPSTLWLPNRGSGFASSRGIGFKWGPKGPKEKNIIQAVGQKVPLVGTDGKAEIYKTIHLLAAATKELPVTNFLVEFADGTQQLNSFPLSRWDALPAHGEEIAFSVTRTHTPAGEDAKPVHFYRYTIRIAEPKKLAALILPNNPEIKIAAITLEK